MCVYISFTIRKRLRIVSSRKRSEGPWSKCDGAMSQGRRQLNLKKFRCIYRCNNLSGAKRLVTISFKAPWLFHILTVHTTHTKKATKKKKQRKKKEKGKSNSSSPLKTALQAKFKNQQQPPPPSQINKKKVDKPRDHNEVIQRSEQWVSVSQVVCTSGTPSFATALKVNTQLSALWLGIGSFTRN